MYHYVRHNQNSYRVAIVGHPVIVLLVFNVIILGLTNRPMMVNVSSVNGIFPFVNPLPLNLFTGLRALRFFNVKRISVRTYRQERSFLRCRPNCLTSMEAYEFGVDIQLVITGKRSSKERSFRTSLCRGTRHAKVVRICEEVITIISTTCRRIKLTIRRHVGDRLRAVNQHAKALMCHRPGVLASRLMISEFHCDRHAHASETEYVQHRCRGLTRQARRFSWLTGAFHGSTIVVKGRCRESLVFRGFLFCCHTGMTGGTLGEVLREWWFFYVRECFRGELALCQRWLRCGRSWGPYCGRRFLPFCRYYARQSNDYHGCSISGGPSGL